MIVIGAVTRTGLAIAVTLSGTVAAPRFLARREIELVPEGLPAQPYHAAWMSHRCRKNSMNAAPTSY